MGIAFLLVYHYNMDIEFYNDCDIIKTVLSIKIEGIA